MPPKVRITREQVVEAAAEIVRRKGPSGLTAKALAAGLSSSTQPIFWQFENMEEVREAVFGYALQQFARCLRREVPGVTVYKAVGLNYIRFAAEEREFFKLLFMSGKGGGDLMASEAVKYVLEVLEREEHVMGERAQNIFEEMWLFCHGIATMIATENREFSPQRIRQMLTEVYRGLLAAPSDQLTGGRDETI